MLDARAQGLLVHLQSNAGVSTSSQQAHHPMLQQITKQRSKALQLQISTTDKDGTDTACTMNAADKPCDS